jgi:hypothetical protein
MLRKRVVNTIAPLLLKRTSNSFGVKASATDRMHDGLNLTGNGVSSTQALAEPCLRKYDSYVLGQPICIWSKMFSVLYSDVTLQGSFIVGQVIQREHAKTGTSWLAA